MHIVSKGVSTFELAPLLGMHILLVVVLEATLFLIRIAHIGAAVDDYFRRSYSSTAEGHSHVAKSNQAECLCFTMLSV